MADVEFHRRGLATFYLVMTFIFAALGVLFLFGAAGMASGNDEHKWLGVLQWLFGGFLWLLSAPKMWTMGKAYRKSAVRFTASEVIFDTASGQHYAIPYASITATNWDPSARKRLLTINTADAEYNFDARSSPRIAKVAALVKQRVGSN